MTRFRHRRSVACDVLMYTFSRELDALKRCVETLERLHEVLADASTPEQRRKIGRACMDRGAPDGSTATDADSVSLWHAEMSFTRRDVREGLDLWVGVRSISLMAIPAMFQPVVMTVWAF